MNAFMTELAEKANPTPENPFPVAVVVTKADLLNNFDGYLQEKTVETVKQFFKNTLFVPDSPWLVGIIPVTLGTELAQNIELGMVEPINVHLPVTFAVLHKLIKQTNRVSKTRGVWSTILPGFDARQPTDIKTRMQQLNQELIGVPIYSGDRQIPSLLEWCLREGWAKK